jgi:hypothetical protein
LRIRIPPIDSSAFCKASVDTEVAEFVGLVGAEAMFGVATGGKTERDEDTASGVFSGPLFPGCEASDTGNDVIEGLGLGLAARGLPVTTNRSTIKIKWNGVVGVVSPNALTVIC